MFCGFILLFLLATQFPPLLSLLNPRILKPENKYGEFAFRIEYEIEGEIMEYEDLVIAEYGGTRWNAGSGNDNVWNVRLESGNDVIELYRSDAEVIFIPILGVLSGSYLLDNISGVNKHLSDVPIIRINMHVDGYLTDQQEEIKKFFTEGTERNWKFFMGSRWHASEEALLNAYGIKLLDFEHDRPMGNYH